jgi:2-polyprenyl-3-methyl-5-hydroxy-6-metoxy-1,4-benzoquinol methylase
VKTFSKSPGNEAVRHVACVLCGKDDAAPWNGLDSGFVCCRSCGLVYQQRQPVQDDLLKRYDREYFDYEIENERRFFRLMELGLKDIRFTRIESELPEPRTFIDIGCATGMLVEHMKGRGWSEMGVEVCAPAARHGIEKRGVHIHIGTLESARLAEGSFDVVHCSHLIEHLNDPRSFVREARRIVSPRGCFLVTTPNTDGFQAKLFKTEWRSMIVDHMYLFSRRTLARLLQEEGFRVVRTRTWGGLAAGTAPRVVKACADRLAKVFGFGDVVLMMAVPAPGRE